jgi:hypothetical protein
MGARRLPLCRRPPDRAPPTSTHPAAPSDLCGTCKEAVRVMKDLMCDPAIEGDVVRGREPGVFLRQRVRGGLRPPQRVRAARLDTQPWRSLEHRVRNPPFTGGLGHRQRVPRNRQPEGGGFLGGVGPGDVGRGIVEGEGRRALYLCAAPCSRAAESRRHPLPPQCADVINGVGPALFDWLRLGTDADAMCAEVGVCGAPPLSLFAAKAVRVWGFGRMAERGARSTLATALNRPPGLPGRLAAAAAQRLRPQTRPKP